MYREFGSDETSNLTDGHAHRSEVVVFEFGRREPLSALRLHLKQLMGMVLSSRIAETLGDTR